MATIKSFTDLEQSKVLVEILPLESSDMCYIQELLAYGRYGDYKPYIGDLIPAYGQDKIECWSLAALFGVLPNYQLQTQDDGIGVLCSCKGKFNIATADNPVDTCVEMIIKLHEINML